MSRSPEHPDALSFDEARRRIAATVEPIADVEEIGLAAALGRILAGDVVARHAVPPHDNSAMDGYALRADSSSRTGFFRVVGQSRAGAPFVGRVGPGDCVRILTGAVVPDGCDAVVPQEQVVPGDGNVTIDRAIVPGQHVRRAGEDLAVGAVALSAGRRLTPADVGVAASIGEGTLRVTRRPRVAVFSTGDELRDIGDDLEAGPVRGLVRDSNRYTIIAMLARLGIDAIDLGIVRDDPDALEATLRHARGDTVRADAIITSGGASVGDADHTRAVMRRAGDVSFWSLAFKPGRPMAFGTVSTGSGRALLFGLPGNPVAVMVVFYALVREALFALMGARIDPVAPVDAVSDVAIPKAVGRTEFLRGRASRGRDGWQVRPTGGQGSGILRSMSEANCLIVLDHDRGPVAGGEIVGIWLFDGLI